MIDRVIEIRRSYGREKDVEKTKEMRISRKPYKIQSMVDQNNPRM
jgi:hypothetical protein